MMYDHCGFVNAVYITRSFVVDCPLGSCTVYEMSTVCPGVNAPLLGFIAIEFTVYATETAGTMINNRAVIKINRFNPFIINLTRTTVRYLPRTYSISSPWIL